ncbi:unnamed protein product [Phaeothamnion confervicola]
MKCIGAATLFCLVSSMATAQISACRAVKQPDPRLACYDKLFPPSLETMSKAAKPSSYDDISRQEENRMKELLKPICKNC